MISNMHRRSRIFCIFLFLWNFLVTTESAQSIFSAFSPASVTLPASTTTLTRLNSPVNCDDADPADVCTCYEDSGSTQPFEVFWLSTDTSYYVYYDATQPLTPSTSYSVPVECRTNNNGVIDRHTLTVTIPANNPPVITNYPSDSATVDASTTLQYTEVYQVQATDPENDAITYSMTASPDLGYFTIGAGNGKIYSLVDMRTASVTSHTLTITATDGYNTVSNFVVTLTIDNVNTAPEIQGLPATVTLSEDAVAGTSIIDLSIVDPDPYIDLNPVCSSADPADNYKFTYDSASDRLVVASDNAFDYESKSSYTITCSVFDGYQTTDGSDVLTLNIVNVNEPPEFDEDYYYCAIDEGTPGTSTCTLNAVITDPDGTAVSSVNFLTTNNGNRFQYDSNTDKVSFAVNYDIDQFGLPTDTELILAAVDSGGATGTATVKIHVNDVNDNACDTDNLQIFSLDQYDSLQQLGSFTQSDDDLTSPNNDTHFEVTSATPATATDHIYVTRDGGIYYTNLFDSTDGGISFRIYVRCVDEGSPATTATTTVIVAYTYYTTPSTTTPTTTTTTTTTTAAASDTVKDDIWDYDEFKAAFGALMGMLGLALLLGLAYLCYRCCLGVTCPPMNCCPPRRPPPPPKKVAPYKAPPPQRPPPPLRRWLPDNPNWNNFAWYIGDKNEGTL